MQPDLTISVISADNLGLLLPCLRSVYENTHTTSLEVFLVDNASSDGTATAVETEFPQIKIIRNEARLGFSTNNNTVLRQGQGRYLMLLNDDTLVLDSALDHMVQFMDDHPEAGVAGSSLLNPDGSFQPAVTYFPHPILEAIWPSSNWTYRLARGGKHAFEIDTVSGCAMLVRAEVITSAGVLDQAYDPIYSEETDWCYRIRKAGWKIYSLPDARIVHFGSYTMNRMMREKYELLISHKCLFFRKHHGILAARAYLAIVVGLSCGKFLFWSLRAGLPKHRQRAMQRLAVHRYIVQERGRLWATTR